MPLKKELPIGLVYSFSLQSLAPSKGGVPYRQGSARAARSPTYSCHVWRRTPVKLSRLRAKLEAQLALGICQGTPACGWGTERHPSHLREGSSALQAAGCQSSLNEQWRLRAHIWRSFTDERKGSYLGSYTESLELNPSPSLCRMH